jgi:hypothetical protein
LRVSTWKKRVTATSVGKEGWVQNEGKTSSGVGQDSLDHEAAAADARARRREPGMCILEHAIHRSRGG